MVNAKLKRAVQEFTVLMARFETMIWSANGFGRIMMDKEFALPSL